MEEKFGRQKLEAISQELIRQKNSKYDVVVPTDELIAVKDGDIIKLDVPIIDDTGTKERFGITNHCHSQIATKTGIPMRYYRRMQDEGKLELLTNNINTWLPSKEKRLIRILDGKVRALLSDRYRVVDNYDVLWQAMDTFELVHKKEQYMLDGNGEKILDENDKPMTYHLNIEFRDVKVTEQHLYIKVTSPELSAEIQKVNGKEAICGGVIISNSEVGAGAISVKPFIEVLECSNGLISDRILKRIHAGKTRDIGVINWSDETLMHEDLALFGKISDMIKTTFDPVIFNAWVDEINNVASKEVSKPQLAVDNIIKHFKLPEKRKEALLDQFFKEDNSQWGLAMAVTRVAHDEEDYENKIELERIGAQILELPSDVITREEK